MLIQTVNLIPLNEDKTRILLFKRSDLGENLDKWCLPGGTLNQFEKSQRGLEREIYEETGCEISNLRFFREYKSFIEKSQIQSKYYTGNLIGNVLLNPHELSEHKWFKLNSCLKKLDFAFNHKEVIFNYIESKNFY